jgi:hypothetical protein
MVHADNGNRPVPSDGRAIPNWRHLVRHLAVVFVVTEDNPAVWPDQSYRPGAAILRQEPWHLWGPLPPGIK